MQERTLDELGESSSARLEEVFRQKSEMKALEADAVIRQRLEGHPGQWRSGSRPNTVD